MNFANRGEHMADPECVRCSACVQTCPTGVLQFGQVDGEERIVGLDSLVASPVLQAEGGDDRMYKNGKMQMHMERLGIGNVKVLKIPVCWPLIKAAGSRTHLPRLIFHEHPVFSCCQ